MIHVRPCYAQDNVGRRLEHRLCMILRNLRRRSEWCINARFKSHLYSCSWRAPVIVLRKKQREHRHQTAPAHSLFLLCALSLQFFVRSDDPLVDSFNSCFRGVLERYAAVGCGKDRRPGRALSSPDATRDGIGRRSAAAKARRTPRLRSPRSVLPSPRRGRAPWSPRAGAGNPSRRSKP